ncbi:AAA family ATPase [Mesorhizobium sp. ASY16-5R]|uniref:AAA family ATPase n=1 Tax=Mesorhizobium sp. ASY16-5R TaxID=3445772 RepID=UPI003F9EE2B6
MAADEIAARMIANADRDEETYRHVDYEGKEAHRRRILGIESFTADTLAGKEVPARQWHVDGLIPAEVPCTLGADGGVGKSVLALQLCAATVTKGYWAGRAVKQGRAVYLSAEDDKDEIHRRLFDIAAGAQVSLADLHDLTILPLAGKDAQLAVSEGKTNTLKQTKLFAGVEELLHDLKPSLMVIDTLADTFGGNEIDRAQARQFVGFLRGLCIRHSVTILLLAHPSLAGMSTGSGSSGSTAWSNSVRARLYLDRVKGSDDDEPDPDLRVLRVVKSNYARLGEEIRLRWQAGTFVPAVGQDSGTVMSAQNKAERVFMSLLAAYNADGRHVGYAPAGNYAPKVFAADTRCEGVTKKAFTQAMNALFAAGKIRIEEFGPQSRPLKRLVEVQS